jgi:hypothetical protein
VQLKILRKQTQVLSKKIIFGYYSAKLFPHIRMKLMVRCAKEMVSVLDEAKETFYKYRKCPCPHTYENKK